ncbi:hypothetical protein ACLOJK_004979 [Asimina triloba]
MAACLMRARSVVGVACWRHANLLPTSIDVADLLKEQAVDVCMRGGFGAGATVGADGVWQRADKLIVEGDDAGERRATMGSSRGDGQQGKADVAGMIGGVDWRGQQPASDEDEAAMFRQSDGVDEENSWGHCCDDRQSNQGQ